MEVSRMIVLLMAIFMAIGAIDRALLGNRFGYGQKFDEGINAMGPVACGMLGFMCIAPAIGQVLTPIVSPFFIGMGMDPAMLGGAIFGIANGGYALASAMTTNPQIAAFSGLIQAGMFGSTLSYAIPVALGIIESKDRTYFAKGIMAGVIPIPIACLFGGLLIGLPVGWILANLKLILLLALLLCLGLWKIPGALINGFGLFSKLITSGVYLSLALAIFTELTGIVLISGMAAIGPNLIITGQIGLTLAGAYPFVHFVTTVFQQPLKKIGSVVSVNNVAVGGMIAVLANNIPMMGMLSKMNGRGKVVAVAFSVPAAFAFGDHLAYVSANAPEYVVPVVAAKLLGGVLAIMVALLITPGSKTLPLVET